MHEILDSGLLCVGRKRKEEGRTEEWKVMLIYLMGRMDPLVFILSWILKYFINILSINSKINKEHDFLHL